MEVIRFDDFVRADLRRTGLKWEAWEDEFLRKNYGKVQAWKIGLILGRSEKAIVHRAKKLGLSKPRGTHPKYIFLGGRSDV